MCKFEVWVESVAYHIHELGFMPEEVISQGITLRELRAEWRHEVDPKVVAFDLVRHH